MIRGMNDFTNNPEDNLNHLSDNPSGAAENLQDRAEEMWETVQDQTGRAVREGTAYVRENPVPVVVGALAFGVVLGLLFSGRESSARERYVDEPLENTHGLLLGLLVAIGAFFRNQLKSASSAAEDFTDRVRHDVRGGLKPLRKAAKRVSKKLR